MFGDEAKSGIFLEVQLLVTIVLSSQVSFIFYNSISMKFIVNIFLINNQIELTFEEMLFFTFNVFQLVTNFYIMLMIILDFNRVRRVWIRTSANHRSFLTEVSRFLIPFLTKCFIFNT